MNKIISLLISFLILFAMKGYTQDVSKNLPETNQETPVNHSSLSIPNAFTPNGDGVNDWFRIHNLTNEKIVEFKIFNRWGTIVYFSKNDNQGWDGKFKGRPQPVGVYGYMIKIAYPDNIIETYKGTITLLR